MSLGGSPPAQKIPAAQPVLRRVDPNQTVADALAARRGAASNRSGAGEASGGGMKSKLGA